MITTKQLRPHRFLTLRLFLSNLCGLLLAVLLLNNTANSATVDPKLLFLSDFETGNIQSPASNPDGWSEQSCYPYSFEVVTSPVRAGNYAIKIFLSQNDEYLCFGAVPPDLNWARAQIVKSDPSETKLTYHAGNWIGYSVFLPADFPPNAEVMLFEFWQSIIHAMKENGTEIIHDRWGATDTKTPDGTADLYTGTPSKGVWVDWIIYCYASWESDGVLKVWRNGNLVVNKNGPNCMRTFMGWTPPMFKLYKSNWLWHPTDYDELIVYFDEIRMVDGPDTQEYYDLVAPPPQVLAPTNVKASPAP
jgi:hypothetical protein